MAKRAYKCDICKNSVNWSWTLLESLFKVFEHQAIIIFALIVLPANAESYLYRSGNILKIKLINETFKIIIGFRN